MNNNLFTLFLLLLLACFTTVQAQTISNLYINELMASNNTITDNFNESDDWVEIYNANDTIVNLQGLYLSDDDDNLEKWIIENPLFIPANGYLVLWLDGQVDQGANHASFKLDTDGESVLLSQSINSNTLVIDEIDFPALSQNISYGRFTDGFEQWVLFEEATPAESNNGTDLFFEPEINFSLGSGFYNSAITLILQSSDSDATIRWTTDGSFPTEFSNLYTSPILLTETTLIKATAFKPGFAPSAVSDEFYMIAENHDLPVIQISMDPKSLFDEEEGMYVTGTNGKLTHCSPIPRNWNQDWEKPAAIRFFEAGGTEAFRVNAGIKIGGGCSRDHSMKPFNVFLRNGTYGDSIIDYPLFPKSEVSRYKRFKLRASGSDYPLTHIRDGAIQSVLFNQLDIDQMAYRPVVLYLNGDYWGFYGMRELFSKHYIAAHHQVNPDSLDFIKIPFANVRELKEGDFIAWDNLVSYFRNNDFTSDAVYEEVSSKIDINEYINYHIAQIYIANYDWPGNNVAVWRNRNKGKWRWLFYDTDWSTSIGGNHAALPSFNAIDHATTDTQQGWPNDEASTLFLRKLLENQKFREEFAQRSCTIGQTIFDPDRTSLFIDSISASVASEMPRVYEQFNDAPSEWTASGANPAGGNMENWFSLLNEFKFFFEDRLAYFLQHQKDQFNFEDLVTIRFNVDDNTNGKVVLHKNEMSIPPHYSGAYFQNIPIKIKAIADDGYYFVRWIETRDTAAGINFVVDKETTLTPLFLRNGTVEQPLSESPFIDVFPNPVKEELNLKFSDLMKVDFTIRVYNVLGLLVYGEALLSDVSVLEHSINIEGWATGIYFLKAKIGGKEIAIKFLKE